MCGITGIINFSEEKVDSSQINKTMLDTIKHRGSDADGIFLKDLMGFGYVHLSIIDFSSAVYQPMFSNDGRHCVKYNDEIYHYIKLKKEHNDQYSIKLKTDTEVPPAAYITRKESCLSKLSSDFFFVIYDIQEKIIFGSSDRFGINLFTIIRMETDLFRFNSAYTAMFK